MFVVTGGGSGIGRALAQALAARGERVLIVGRRESALLETARDSVLIEIFSADVSTASGRLGLIEHLQTVPRLKGIVHNAGIIEPIVPVSTIPLSSWQHVMATNVEAPLFLTQAMLHQLQGGKVLHIGSGAAYFPVAGWSAYCASKAALSMLTRCWQLEHHEVAFASVMPGIIDTDMQGSIRQAKSMDLEKLEFFKQMKQGGGLISPETVAEFLCWLLLEVDVKEYSAQEWDIYETAHHPAWLVEPFRVPPL